MKQLLFSGMLILFSFTLYGQNNNGFLRSILYIDSINNLSKDTFEIVFYNSLNEQVISRSIGEGIMFMSLPVGMYSMKCANKLGMSITIEGVEIKYKSTVLHDINVSSLSEH